MSNRNVRVGTLAALALVHLAGAPTGAMPLAPTAVAADVAIERYEVDLELREDGAYLVTERITFRVVSGEMTFGSRHVPTRRLDRIADMRVTAVGLGPLEVRERRRIDRHEVRWEHAPTAEGGTVVLSYRVEGALRQIGDRNEVFWAAVGPEWDLPIEAVEIRLSFPAGFAAEAGAIELDPHVTPVRDGEMWVARFSPGALEPGEGFQLRAGFPWVMEGKEVGLRRPEVQAALAGVVLLLLGLTGGARGYRTWRATAGSGPVRFPNVRLEEAAVLLHEGAGAQRAFPALMFDLARRGHLTLVSHDDDDDGIEVAARIHPNPDDAPHPFESELLSALEAHESLTAFGTDAEDLRARMLDGVRDRLVAAALLEDRSSEAAFDRRTGVRALVVSAALLLPIFWWGPWYLTAAAGTVGFGIGRLVRGARRVEPSDVGRRVQADLLAWLREVGEALDRAIEEAPIRAADHYVELLPWLTLGPGVGLGLDQRLRDALDDEEDALAVPGWVEDRSRAAREAIDEHSAAYAAFFQVQETAARTALLGAPTAGASAALAGSTAATTMVGAVGVGAAGGGGGTAG